MWRFAVWLCLPAVLVACGSGFQSGKAVYDENCLPCHGPRGQGDGPFADNFLSLPPDLTILARNNGGEYPALYVANVIEGQGRGEHFSAAMPEFSQTLSGKAVRMDALVAYVESLQK